MTSNELYQEPRPLWDIIHNEGYNEKRTVGILELHKVLDKGKCFTISDALKLESSLSVKLGAENVLGLAWENKIIREKSCAVEYTFGEYDFKTVVAHIKVDTGKKRLWFSQYISIWVIMNYDRSTCEPRVGDKVHVTMTHKINDNTFIASGIVPLYGVHDNSSFHKTNFP